LIEAPSVRIDGDDQWSEFTNAKLPEALGHKVLPPHILDFLDLQGLECGGSANDGQIDGAELFHGFNASCQQPGFTHNGAYPVLVQQSGSKAVHPGAGGGAD